MSTWALVALLLLPATQARAQAEPTPLDVSLLAPLTLGDVMVVNESAAEIELTATGARRSDRAVPFLGSSGYAPGRLRISGDPEDCVRLRSIANTTPVAGGTAEIVRVLFLSATDGTEGQDEVRVELDADGETEIQVGVVLRLTGIGRSEDSRLTLTILSDRVDTGC